MRCVDKGSKKLTPRNREPVSWESVARKTAADEHSIYPEAQIIQRTSWVKAVPRNWHYGKYDKDRYVEDSKIVQLASWSDLKNIAMNVQESSPYAPEDCMSARPR